MTWTPYDFTYHNYLDIQEVYLMVLVMKKMEHAGYSGTETDFTKQIGIRDLMVYRITDVTLLKKPTTIKNVRLQESPVGQYEHLYYDYGIDEW